MNKDLVIVVLSDDNYQNRLRETAVLTEFSHNFQARFVTASNWDDRSFFHRWRAVVESVSAVIIFGEPRWDDFVIGSCYSLGISIFFVLDTHVEAAISVDSGGSLAWIHFVEAIYEIIAMTELEDSQFLIQ